MPHQYILSQVAQQSRVRNARPCPFLQANRIPAATPASHYATNADATSSVPVAAGVAWLRIHPIQAGLIAFLNRGCLFACFALNDEKLEGTSQRGSVFAGDVAHPLKKFLAAEEKLFMLHLPRKLLQKGALFVRNLPSGGLD